MSLNFSRSVGVVKGQMRPPWNMPTLDGIHASLGPKAKLVDEPDHVGVAGEEVVVAALQPPAAHVKGGRLPAEEGRALEDLGLVALPQQLEGGGEARGATADDSDPHAVPASPAAEARSSSRLDRASPVSVWLLKPRVPNADERHRRQQRRVHHQHVRRRHGHVDGKVHQRRLREELERPDAPRRRTG